MIKFFEFLTLFDWVTPSIGFVEDFVNDPTLLQSNSWTFFIPYEQALQAGWNANNIEALLHSFGIHTWGGQYCYPQDEYFFRVSRDEAGYAEYFLLQRGIPISRGQGAPGRDNGL